MTRLWVLTLVCASSLLTLQGIANAQANAFHASGEFAETFANVNGASVNVFAARGCITNPCFTNQTILVFFSFARTANGSVFIEGSGVIPDDAFQATSPEHASLNVDTSQLSGFNTTLCTFVPGSGFSCTSGGPTGVIQIDFQRTQQGSLTALREAHITMGPFVTDFHQNQDFFSAVASGSFLGGTFSESNRSHIGTNKDSTITLSRQN